MGNKIGPPKRRVEPAKNSKDQGEISLFVCEQRLDILVGN